MTTTARRLPAGLQGDAVLLLADDSAALRLIREEAAAAAAGYAADADALPLTAAALRSAVEAALPGWAVTVTADRWEYDGAVDAWLAVRVVRVLRGVTYSASAAVGVAGGAQPLELQGVSRDSGAWGLEDALRHDDAVGGLSAPLKALGVLSEVLTAARNSAADAAQASASDRLQAALADRGARTEERVARVGRRADDPRWTRARHAATDAERSLPLGRSAGRLLGWRWLGATADRQAYAVEAVITDASGARHACRATFTGPTDAASAALGRGVVVVTDGFPGGLAVTGYAGVPFGPVLFAEFYGDTDPDR